MDNEISLTLNTCEAHGTNLFAINASPFSELLRDGGKMDRRVIILFQITNFESGNWESRDVIIWYGSWSRIEEYLSSGGQPPLLP